jgi:hypothetical protein
MMKKYELRIPRAVRMTEWEILVVEANNEVDALDNALHHTNVISAKFDTDDYETIDRYDDEIEIREIENGL